MRLKPLIALASAVTVAAVLIVTVPGCGSGYSKTEVKVLYSNGNPVPGAMVTLMPKDPNVGVLIVSGLTDDSGMCSLETQGKKGVPKGSYKAMVVKLPAESLEGDIMEKMKNRTPTGPPGAKGGTVSLLPAKYGEVGSTPFSVEIPHSGVFEMKLDVDGPAK
jgi:hypothetical protein